MGALSRPGPQVGYKGPPSATTREGQARPFAQWFWSFLRDELRPYPGRWQLVIRMTLAATLTMLCIMTFRLPGAAISAYYTLLLSRETPLSTLRAAGTVLLMYVLGAAFSMLGVVLFVDYPLTHFLWVLFSVFLCFYIIKVTTNYVAGAAFAFIITIAIPIWDTNAPTALLVVGTLWAAGSVSVGLICTVIVEFAFSAVELKDELAIGLLARSEALSGFFRALSRDDPKAPAAAQRVEQLAIVGVSRLRRLALNTPRSGSNPERRSTSVALVGRAIDLAAALPHVASQLEPEAKERLGRLADRLTRMKDPLRKGYLRGGMPQPSTPTQLPVVGELERTVDLLEMSLSREAVEDLPIDTQTSANPGIFVPDALSNPEHLHYSLRGCLAAMLCYLIFNGIVWRGLSTSLATCVVTALTSVGSSRQKQILRLAGAIVGGLVLGMGSQVLILPMLDSIAGFAVLFVVVTLISAWVSTSSPRLSYMGQQIALAFYLIHLQEYFPQTNLAIGRDRVMGVALGLAMMWLVFDTLGSKPAAQVMRDLFATNLNLLAELARPWRNGKPADLPQIRALRERISQNFGTVNSQADAVLFEVGPSRERDLRLRERLLAWQPRLRSLFLLQVGLLEYRARVNPSELAPELLAAQNEFDEGEEAILREMAGAFQQRRAPGETVALQERYGRLEDAAKKVYDGDITPRARGVLAFSNNIAHLLEDLRAELAKHIV